MAKTRSIVNSFLSGELSPLIKGNTGLAQYYQGLQKAENVVIVPQGGVKRRAGSQFVEVVRDSTSRVVGAIATMPNGGTPSLINDNNDTTSTSTTNGIASSYVIASYDLGSAQEVYFADIRQYFTDDETLLCFTNIEYSDNNIDWSNSAIFDDSPKITATNHRVRVDSGAHRYWRLIISQVFAGTGSGIVTLSGFDLYVSQGGAGNVKLIDFNTASLNRYVVALSAGNAGIIRSNVNFPSFGDDIKVPYTDTEIPNVRHVSTENILLLFHENHPTQRVIFDSSFTGGDLPYTNVPLFDFNDNLSPTPVSEQQDLTFGSFSLGMNYKVDVDGVLSKDITFAGDSTPDEQAATEFNLRKNLQDMPNFGETGISVNRQGANLYRITIGGESADSFRLFSGFNTTGTSSATLTFVKVQDGSPRKEPVWSSARGYPRLGAFYEGRLWIGGTRDKKQTLLASKSGDLLNFDTGEGADDEAIFSTITSRNLTEITDIYPGRNLQVFTAGGEYADLGSLITPSTINLRSQTSNGSKYIPSSEADGAVIFADSNGKTLREFLYTFNEDSYRSDDISVLSSHLIDDPVQLTFLNGTSSEDANWLFIVNSNGEVAILNKLRAQDINGFTNMKMATPYNITTEIVSAHAVNDQVYLAVKRYDSNDDPVSSIEIWDFDRLMDGSFKNRVENPITASPYSDLYLRHLIGYEVSVVADGAVLPKRTIVDDGSGNGQIEFTARELSDYDQYEIGINFIPSVQPMPINTSIGSGDNFMRLKKIVRMNLRVLSTYGIYVDGVPVPFRSFGVSTIGDPPQEFSGILDDIYPAEGWDRDTTPVFSCPDPTPMHIQAIEMEVESS